MVPRGHRTRGHDHARDVQPARRHQHPRRDLVAVRQQDQPVQLVGLSDGLDRVGDQFPRRQGVVHPRVTHRHTVADSGHRKQERDAAARADTPLDFPLQGPHPNMTRYQIRKARTDTHKRPFHLFPGHTRRVYQRPVRHPFQTVLHLIASHPHAPIRFTLFRCCDLFDPG